MKSHCKITFREKSDHISLSRHLMTVNDIHNVAVVQCFPTDTIHPLINGLFDVGPRHGSRCPTNTMATSYR